ncbi:MAG: FAD-dependent oxidoreductase [Pseudolabrys sp.]|nr:FAD-dependent oxidoreductase [Pseudolabrys sp.]
MASDETEVAIIGGGAAGIAAARHLHDAGVPCLLIEARERLGGRAWTQQKAGFALDLGCGWLHSADLNPWTKIAKEQGHQIDKTPPPWTRPSLPQGFPVEKQLEYREAFNRFHERVVAKLTGDQDYPESEAFEPNGPWNGLLSAVTTYISGAEPEKVSARDFDNYADTHENWRVIEGYGATIVAHATPVPRLLGAVVSRIDRNSKRLKIATGRGDITAERVIVCLPTSILGATELFAPALPEKMQAAVDLPLGLADKLFLSMERPEEFPEDSRLFGRTDRAATATYHLRPFGRPVIECYFGGDNAWALERGGEAAFFDFARQELTDLLGSDFTKRITPLAMNLWGADPFSRGAYSYAPPGKTAARAILAAPVEGRIFFAGEACSRESYSTAHGAYATGVAAAQAILAMRKQKPPG